MMLLQDEPPQTQDLVNDEFLLQLQATQQITRELNEARDLEHERRQAIREAQEAREVDQQQQTTLAQFRMFREFLASQEAAGRLLDDSGSDT